MGGRQGTFHRPWRARRVTVSASRVEVASVGRHEPLPRSARGLAYPGRGPPQNGRRAHPTSDAHAAPRSWTRGLADDGGPRGPGNSRAGDGRDGRHNLRSTSRSGRARGDPRRLRGACPRPAAVPHRRPELGEPPRPPWTLRRRAIDLQPIVHWLIEPYKPALISRWGTEGAAARFRASGGHPLVLAARASLVEGVLAPTVSAIELALLTSIPSSLPGVLIRLHERWRAFERPRSTLGDSTFDAMFVVSGHADAARLLLDAPARRALLSLRALAPRVRIGSGVAEIGLTMPWPQSAAIPLPAPAVTFVTALRKRIAGASSPEAP
jgi:hypothetical protein